MCCLPLIIAYFVLAASSGALQGLGEGREAALCKARLGKLAAALNAYAADNDGKYPPGEIWVDASWRYAAKKDPVNESESVFRCPSISKLRTGEYGYAMFKDEVAKLRAEPEAAGSRVLVFDAEVKDRNSLCGFEALPIPPRHNSARENYAALTDGSVKPVQRP